MVLIPFAWGFAARWRIVGIKRHLVAVAAAWRAVASRFAAGLGIAAAVVHACLAEGGIVVQVAGAESATQVEVHLHPVDVLRDVEVGRCCCASRCVCDSEREDSQLVKSHALTLQQHLAQTHLHLNQHTSDGALGIHAMVFCHVFHKLVELHQLMHRAGEPFAVDFRLLLLVLIQYIINHKAIKFKDCVELLPLAKVIISTHPLFVSVALRGFWAVIARHFRIYGALCRYNFVFLQH